MTHDALITSVLRYGLGVLGSRPPDDLMNKIELRVANVASRRITGSPCITRVGALRFVAGARSARNLYWQHCGHFLHSALLRNDSGIRHRVRQELRALLHAPALNLRAEISSIGLAASFVADASGMPMSVLEKTREMTHEYAVLPNTTEVRLIFVCFLIATAGLRRSERDRRGLFVFEGTHPWLDVGLQSLRQVGWRPECSQPQVVNIARALPPNCLEACFFPGKLPPSHPSPGQRGRGTGGNVW